MKASACVRRFFFFQAEDGIRDYKVTGVQTCALPVSKPVVAGARSRGLAIRIAAKGGPLRAYRLPGLVEVPGAVRGKLPPVRRVVGLDPETDLLFAVTEKREVVALDVAGGRLDTVATAVEQAALGPDGTLYAVDDKRRVVTVARRVRLAWPQSGEHTAEIQAPCNLLFRLLP